LGIGVAIVSLTAAESDPVHFDWLPWNEHTLPCWLIGLGILGLFFVFLAVIGRLRILLFLFAAGIFALIFKGLFMSTHGFTGPAEFRLSIYIVLGALIAIIGAWPTSASRAREYKGEQ
jgi:uncharacterized membrane protein YdcZ (DUF606 family)